MPQLPLLIFFEFLFQLVLLFQQLFCNMIHLYLIFAKSLSHQLKHWQDANLANQN